MREYELILARFQNPRDLKIIVSLSIIMIYVINLCQSDLVIIMDVNASVGKNREIRDEGNKGQAKKAKTKQSF